MFFFRTLIAGDHVVGVGSAVLDSHCGDMKQYVIDFTSDIGVRVGYLECAGNGGNGGTIFGASGAHQIGNPRIRRSV